MHLPKIGPLETSIALLVLLRARLASRGTLRYRSRPPPRPHQFVLRIPDSCLQ